VHEQKINLTSSEIASLWTGYMNDSMSISILGFMLKYIEDPKIKPVIQHTYDLSSEHLEHLRVLFKQEKFAVPTGFTEQDVNMDAPWLFSDVFCLTYVNHMAMAGMVSYSGFVSMSYREDIRNYFTKALNETAKLYNQSLEIALEMGVNARHPYIEVPKVTDYIDSKKYYNGLNPLSDKRPLNAIEISQLYMNVSTNSIGLMLCLAFAQTSPTKAVQDFMLRSKDISEKQIKSLSSTLLDDNIQMPMLPDVCVSDSTTRTFSDKLIMFHMSLLMSVGIGNYSAAAAASQRADLVIKYERFSAEVARLAKSGADLMIQNSWLEQPPGTKNREKLAKSKQKS
jgi:hypothetical protein